VVVLGAHGRRPDGVVDRDPGGVGEVDDLFRGLRVRAGELLEGDLRGDGFLSGHLAQLLHDAARDTPVFGIVEVVGGDDRGRTWTGAADVDGTVRVGPDLVAQH